MTILLIDIGNSSVKLVDYNEGEGLGRPYRIDKAHLASVDFSLYTLVAVSNVGASQRVEDFIEKVISSSTAIWKCNVDPTRDDLKTEYNPDKLGVDRWLAMLATGDEVNESSSHRQRNRQTSAHIVVDAGTAITLDVIEKDREHIGGQIIAGKPLLRNALHQPAKMQQDSYSQDENKGQITDGNISDLPLGFSTSGCVQFGIMTSLSGVIILIDRLLRRLDKPCKLWFTGGDGEEIKGMYTHYISDREATDSQVEFDANLVFRGMLVQLKNRELIQ